MAALTLAAANGRVTPHAGADELREALLKLDTMLRITCMGDFQLLEDEEQAAYLGACSDLAHECRQGLEEVLPMA